MRHFVFIFLLTILPLHSTLSAATEYHHTSTSSEEGSGHQTQSANVSGESGTASVPYTDLDHDGDFFDEMFSGIASLPTVTPLRQFVASVEQSVLPHQAVNFSKPPERPQWRLAV